MYMKAFNVSQPSGRSTPMDSASTTTAQTLSAIETGHSERAEALRLCLLGELSDAEAGEVLGKSEAAVKMLIHRAVRDLG